MKSISFDQIKTCHVTTVDITVRFIILNFLRFLRKENYNVSVVCSPGKQLSLFKKEGFSFYGVKMTRRITPLRDLISLLKLFLYFRREKFTIVHTYTPKAGILGRIAARMAGVPIIVHTSFGFYIGLHISPWTRRLILFAEKTASYFCDLVFSQNKEDIEMAVREKIINPEKIKLSTYGIDITRFNPLNFSQDFIYKKKKELNIKEKKKVIGMVGRFVKEKGYLDLFKAFKIIKKKNLDVALLLIAPLDKEKNDALNYSIFRDFGIEKEVVVLGREGEISNIEEFYSLMDIFVLPSYREGFPYSIMEASAMGRPVVATDIRGCREAVEDGVTGTLVPPQNPYKLAQALICLLDNQKKCEEFGRNGRKKAEKEFDERLVFDKIKEEYQGLIKEKIHPVKCCRAASSPCEQGGIFNGAKMKLQLLLKRIFDFLGALTGLILLFPLFLIVAVLIKIDSSGPVFFRYERIGKNGRTFYPFKFRTMVQGAVNKGLGYTVAENDERITRLGKFLRKWGIDELSQLINILKGDMSFVGPRPTFRYQVEKYNNFQKKRLIMKPGITSLALIKGRNLLSWEERIKYDVFYVENWSLWQDLKILFLTPFAIFSGKGVYGKDGINDPFI